jgi:hypothetical protein
MNLRRTLSTVILQAAIPATPWAGYKVKVTASQGFGDGFPRITIFTTACLRRSPVVFASQQVSPRATLYKQPKRQDAQEGQGARPGHRKQRQLDRPERNSGSR